MALEAHGEPGRLPLAERLRGHFARRARGVEAAELATFARQLFGRGAGYAERLAAEEAAALVVSAFRFFAAPGPEIRVRAFTPTYANEGWDGSVSILETAMPDRPFIVDTLRCRLAAAGIAIETLLHPIFATRRDADGHVALLAVPEGGAPHESFTHVAIPRTPDAVLARLASDVRSALEDVRLVTDDFAPMVERAQAIAAALDARGRTLGSQAAADATAVADFLRWLVDGAFVFLGYREYAVDPADGAPALRLRAGSGLGLLRREDRSAFRDARPLDALPTWVRARLEAGELLAVGKTRTEAPVHRRARMDDVSVAELDDGGRVVGIRRFLGLLTSKAFAEEAAEIPLLRRQLRRIVAAEHVVPGSHDHKAIVAVFNALPKGHLLASEAGDVRAEIDTILAASRSDEIVVSVSGRPDAPRTTVFVVVPRERFSSEARDAIRELLESRVGGLLLEDQVVLADGGPALLHFAFAWNGAPVPRVDELRGAVAAVVQSWEERLVAALVARHGEQAGERLGARWAGAFSEAYRAETSIERAADDVVLLDAVARDGTPRIALRDAGAVSGTTELRMYVARAPLVLSEFLPVLEHLGLRVLAEDQVIVTPAAAAAVAMHSFFVQDRRGRALDVASVGSRVSDALLAVQVGRTESDPLDRLVLEAGLDWRAVACLRTYCGWAAQAGIAARPVVVAAVVDHPETARLLFEAFAARFRPDGVRAEPGALRRAFVDSLEHVESLRDDVLLRALLDVVEATVRTTFFAPGAPRDWIAIKIRSADLAHLPAPRPLYEIWVHGPTVEAIHLRAGRIARGGIRWSDRPEDFRTEILGLMKTQTVKNAIIVPTGAKGGFVPKRGTPAVEAYKTFMHALLALTDNRVAGRVVHPRGLVVHDEADPYLVVAADRGTATFSDVANAIAAEHGFWLGDAFASGGSHGYDHKALGITARGVWECVRTHFREVAIDADTAPLAVAAIGDPSGDVFGNGMLQSRALRLRAAFNHLHVFLDPAPDPARTFAERERLFRAGRGWDAYDAATLSPGGAVLLRAAKRLVLSPEAQAMLGLPEPAASGDRVVQAILGLDVDLLYNGGVGTYVAATGETDAEVRDAANDAVRVRGADLRTRVVAEGGNLGFTQRARIEYALRGGRIDTDAVDNSAGVDMSDHEVNLKICLRAPLEDGRLTAEGRNACLVEMTDEVVRRVLAHNRAQSRALSVDQARSRKRLPDFRDLATELERVAGLDRALEVLPDGDALRARRGTFLGLTRPELAVLMAYAKIHLQHELLASPLLDDPLVEPYLLGYFPAAVVERYPDAVRAHPLRREIAATALANSVVDECGMTFVQRVCRDTGATATETMRAWTIAWAVADGRRLAAAITDVATADVEVACRLVLERTGERVTKWLLANADRGRPAADVAAELGAAIACVRERLPDWIAGAEAEAFHALRSELEMAGLAPAFARDLATADWLTGALDVVKVAGDVGVDPEAAAARYYGLGQHVDFAWIWAQLAAAEDADRWQRRAVEGLVEDILRARRQLTRLALERGESALPARALTTVADFVRDLRAAPRVGFPALAVLAREVRRLAELA
jgi:glutamate dehydrogenase